MHHGWTLSIICLTNYKAVTLDSAQKIAIAGLATLQVASHGVASACFVLGGDRLCDLPVLGLDLVEIFGRGALLAGGLERPARNDMGPEQGQKLAEASVIGRIGNGEMKGEIGIGCRRP